MMEKFDLTYLNEMSQGDNDLIIEMIEIFCEQVPELIDEFEDYLVAYNYDGIAATAHKAKSSVAVVGLNELAALLKELEVNARNQTNKNDYSRYIEEFKNVSKNAAAELIEYIKNLK
jgi:HPt (histidine-containing phosphotransfer) domain-containing protein